MIIRRGTSIIEIIIATALIGMAIIAALSLMNHSQKQNSYARNLAEATKYTSQAAEWVRQERNRLGWATIANKIESDGVANVYCLNTLPGQENPDYPDFTFLLPEPCADLDYIPDTLYQRAMSVVTDPLNPNLLKFTISVTWMEKEQRQATIELELSQW